MNLRPLFACAAVVLFVTACPENQSAPSPVSATGATTTVSKTAPPWNDTAKNLPAPTVADLTEPFNAAMMLCSHVLNLSPCGLVTSGANDVVVCFSGCQTQIEITLDLLIEQAAVACAGSPPKEDEPRKCALRLPPGAAVDVEAVGRKCDDRCRELVAP